MASVRKPPLPGRSSLPSSRILTTSDSKAISGMGGGISVDEGWAGAGKSAQIGVGVGEMLGVGLTIGSVGESVAGGSVMGGTGVALLRALTVATTLVSSGPFGKSS